MLVRKYSQYTIRTVYYNQKICFKKFRRRRNYLHTYDLYDNLRPTSAESSMKF